MSEGKVDHILFVDYLRNPEDLEDNVFPEGARFTTVRTFDEFVNAVDSDTVFTGYSFGGLSWEVKKVKKGDPLFQPEVGFISSTQDYDIEYSVLNAAQYLQFKDKVNDGDIINVHSKSDYFQIRIMQLFFWYSD